jgi:hypothetical protein
MNPYKPPDSNRNESRCVGIEPRLFRIGLIPATVLFFIGGVAALYAALVVPNVLRDARNGYDARYLMMASILPGCLGGFALTCVIAGRDFVLGRWKSGAKALGVVCGFTAGIVLSIAMLC